jgi:oligopeptide/dipeptide ABC transporter ATP-binding protein
LIIQIRYLTVCQIKGRGVKLAATTITARWPASTFARVETTLGWWERPGAQDRGRMGEKNEDTERTLADNRRGWSLPRVRFSRPAHWRGRVQRRADRRHRVLVQAQILNLIKRLQSDVGFAALFISHDLAAVRYVATRIAVMYSGEIVEFASAAHFYAETQHPYTRALQRASETAGDKTFDLRGTPDDVAAAGCPLHLRCPMTVERCRVEKPQLRAITDGLAACHRADELAATS